MTIIPLLILALSVLTSPVAVADPALTPAPAAEADTPETRAAASAKNGRDPAGFIDHEYRSKEKAVQSVSGSPVPKNRLEPYMPEVDVLSDMDALFAEARRQAEARTNDGGTTGGARRVVLVTPGRMFVGLPMLDPKLLAQAHADPVEVAKSLLGSDKPLDVSVVSFTSLDAMIEGQELSIAGINRSIPFIGILSALAHAGHSVVVFEGHPSAFTAGVRNSDVLIVDSAMLPFLQKDWRATAFKVMHKNAQVFVHDRKSYTLQRFSRKHWFR